MMKINACKEKTSPEKINALERELNVSLPVPYREFLLSHNGGVPERKLFSSKGYGDSLLKEFHGIFKNDAIRDIQSNLETFRQSLAKNLIPICCDQLGNQILLGIRRKYKGKIYFWWHEGPEETDSIFPVAESFTKFLESLKDLPEEKAGNLEDFFRDENTDEIRKLIADGFDVNTRFEVGLTPLQFIVMRNNPAIAKLLIDNGAALDQCLERAITNNHFDMLELLLEAGADPDEPDNMERTPLQQAVIKGGLRAVEILLRHKADASIKDEFGRTLKDLALKVKDRGGKQDMDHIIALLGASTVE